MCGDWLARVCVCAEHAGEGEFAGVRLMRGERREAEHRRSGAEAEAKQGRGGQTEQKRGASEKSHNCNRE